MADYGLTPQGPNIKRLDVILEEMHSGLSEKWGVNTRQNPESLLNHLLTNVADAIADLWEFGEAVYFSQYPANETRKVGATEYWDDKAYRVQNGKLMKEAAHEMD